MTTNGNPHPARSVDFLSRLHDGDLTPAERARFEAHRAHCAECRRAAIEYEDALSMFRSARSTPPRADLAARILRKVQSTNRPRTPFPLGFRVDLGWAALLATALLALMITTPMVLRTPESTLPSVLAPPPSPAPEVVPLQADAPVAPAEPAPERPPRLADARPEAGRDVSNESKPQLQPQAAPPIASARRANPDVRGVAQSSREKSAAAPREEETRAAAAAPETGRIGGEGDTAGPPVVAAVEPRRFTVEPIDGFGPAPATISRSLTVGAGAGGRAFVVLVDSQGAVRKVSEQPSRGDQSGSLDALRAEADGGDDVAASIAKLRFEPGNRPRRLLVRVE